MEWLNEITPYENMGDCDFLGCTGFKYNPSCPFDITFCIFEFCLTKG